MATLILKDPTGRDRVYELLEDMVAGRASTNAIQVLDEKSSRQHFKVERRDGAFFVLDLGSTNGTRVNGVKIAEPTKLNSGDVISVGKTRLEFHVEGEPEALPPAAAPGVELPPKHDDVDNRATHWVPLVRCIGCPARVRLWRLLRGTCLRVGRICGSGTAGLAAAGDNGQQ